MEKINTNINHTTAADAVGNYILHASTSLAYSCIRKKAAFGSKLAFEIMEGKRRELVEDIAAAIGISIWESIASGEITLPTDLSVNGGKASSFMNIEKAAFRRIFSAASAAFFEVDSYEKKTCRDADVDEEIKKIPCDDEYLSMMESNDILADAPADIKKMGRLIQQGYRGGDIKKIMNLSNGRQARLRAKLKAYLINVLKLK